MVAVKAEPEARTMSNSAEKRTFYIVLGGGLPGVRMERPRNVAEGHHIDLLPIVLTIKGLKEAQRVSELNSKIFAKLADLTPDDPEEILAALKESVAVTKLFCDKNFKIYALKVGKLTGIWYGVDWKDVVPLTKYKGAEFKRFKTFMQVMRWMLDKHHLLDQDGLSEGTDDFDDDDDDEANYWNHYPDDSNPPFPARSSSPDLDPFDESISRPASPTKQHRPAASLSKQDSCATTTTWTLPPPSSPTKGKHGLSRAASPTKDIVGASSIERSASVPPPYASAHIPTSSSVRFALSPVTPSSNHGTPRAVVTDA
uniref:Transcriptional repressor rco-1 n=1 Tax=Ganoderma boninense TaxID=34458 RepID=A0A5K1K7V2_9APHY|nr:Transcriptional repressor rco-1 [Ganoderma boninense]